MGKDLIKVISSLLMLKSQKNRFDLGDFQKISKLGRKKRRKITKYIEEKIFTYC